MAAKLISLNIKKHYIKTLQIIAALFVVISLYSFSSKEQEKTLKYDVIYKGDIVGDMLLNQKRIDDNINVKMISNVQMHFILSVKLHSEEESAFKGGKLIYSSVYRKVNGKEKANKQTKALGDIYQTVSDGKTHTVNNRVIDFNIHMLYYREPVNIQRIYSDNFQQFVPVSKVQEHKYKIEFPDGNYNYYYYKNGICNKVEVTTSMANVQMLLKE